MSIPVITLLTLLLCAGILISGLLAVLLDNMLSADPGFAIAVSADDVTGASVPVTLTLTAVRDVDLSGCAVNAVLVENPIEYEEPPGNQGETEFHWVMRDHVNLAGDLGYAKELLAEIGVERDPAQPSGVVEPQRRRRGSAARSC